MFRLAKGVVLTSIFIELKDDMHLCESCTFGTSRRRQGITKGKTSGFVGKYTDNNLGAGVSVDLLHSPQSGLVQQFSVKITSEIFWAAKVMVDHFSDLTYVHLMRSTI